MEICEKDEKARILYCYFPSFHIELRIFSLSAIGGKAKPPKSKPVSPPYYNPVVYVFDLLLIQMSFNIGVWSLPDISILRFNDLIDVLTAGTEWIYSHFQMVVTTGIVLGGYEYPRGVLTVLERAGIELLLIYHTLEDVW